MTFEAWKCGLIAHAFHMELYLEKKIVVPFPSPRISVFYSVASIFLLQNTKFQLKKLKEHITLETAK
jgi:hypothetical protein